MSEFKISISPEVKEMVTAGILRFSGLECREHIPELWNEINLLEDKYRPRFKTPSDALEQLKSGRDLYRSLGLEPTKIRPSSEALLRRVIKGKPLYQINSIVDVCNHCSLAFFLPIGLYDIDRIKGAVEMRPGKKGEEYQGIGKDVIHVSSRLVLSDRRGAFGNPSADSLRTAIHLDTKRVLMVIFAPQAYSKSKMEENLQFAKRIMLRYHPAGKIDSMDIL